MLQIECDLISAQLIIDGCLEHIFFCFIEEFILFLSPLLNENAPQVIKLRLTGCRRSVNHGGVLSVVLLSIEDILEFREVLSVWGSGGLNYFVVVAYQDTVGGQLSGDFREDSLIVLSSNISFPLPPNCHIL